MDFQTAKEKYPHKEKRLTEMEKKAKIATILLDLKNHQGIQKLEEELESMIDGINVKLLYNVPMTEIEREKLMVQKACWLWFINQFPNAKQTLSNIENKLKQYD